MLFITEPLVSTQKDRTRPRKAMSGTQGKYSVNSPPRGLERLKMENGYVGKGGFVGHRRSTGQRFSGRLDKPNLAAGNSSGARSGEERKLNDRDGHGGGSRRHSQRILQVVGEEVVDGWPRWLTDNVPREVLAGLVPKSAVNYDKLDKVSVP